MPRPNRKRSPVVPNSNSAQLLTVEEAAGLLNVGRAKIFDLIKSGRLKSVQIDSARRIRLSALQAYVESL